MSSSRGFYIIWQEIYSMFCLFSPHSHILNHLITFLFNPVLAMYHINLSIHGSFNEATPGLHIFRGNSCFNQCKNN